MPEVVKILKLGAQGDGVTADGLFVPGALPGEIVDVQVTGQAARIVELRQPSPARADPCCAVFGACGGCTLQHAGAGFLADWKAGQVARALGARGIGGVDIRPVLTSPPASRRRVTLAGRRTRKGVVVGLHGRASHQLVPVAAYPVALPAIMAGLAGFELIVAAGASRKGEIRLTITASAAGLDVSTTGGKPIGKSLREELAAIAAAHDFARLSWDGETVVERHPPGQRFGRAEVVPPPGGFLQATADGEAGLLAGVREAVGDAHRAADLFAGSGTFALPLAEHAEVHAVDGSPGALAALDAGWRRARGLKRITTETRDLFRRPLLARDLERFGAVVFDPPRQGAQAQAAELARAAVARIAAVSCNPATFARDARLLIDGGYRLDWVQTIDQFLWTPHVELVAGFQRDRPL